MTLYLHWFGSSTYRKRSRILFFGEYPVSLPGMVLKNEGWSVSIGYPNNRETTVRAYISRSLDREQEDIMNKSLITFLVSVAFMVFSFAATVAVGGMDSSKTAKSHSMMSENPTDAIFNHNQRVGEFIGTEVTNSKGVTLGKIDDLIADEHGRINYLVIGTGGVMGLGEKLVVVPVAEVPVNLADNGKCIVDIDKTVFDQAPSFTSGEWPDLASREWQAEARGYFSNPGPLMDETAPEDAAATPGEESGMEKGYGY